MTAIVTGSTPTELQALIDGGVEALQVLLDLGADPNTPDDSGGLTPLMYAVYTNGNIEVLRTLIEAGADPNGALPDGTTVLMIAALSTSNPDVIRVLIDAGADPTTTNSSGKTAGDALQNNEALADDPLCGKLFES